VSTDILIVGFGMLMFVKCQCFILEDNNQIYTCNLRTEFIL